MKQFDLRNILKQKIDAHRHEFYVKERQIRYVHLGQNIGFEEDGKWIDFKRPVLVLKKIWNQFWVLPMTTKWKDSRFYYRLADIYFNKPSRVILSQLRAIDKSRFIKEIGSVNEGDFLDIKEKLKALML